jgi:hypothetical protein
MSDFYAVFVKRSFHVPGDERSRQAPGHGYPEHTETVTDVIEFLTLDALKEWIAKNSRYGTQFRAVQCSPLTVHMPVVIEVSKETP